MAEQIIDYFSLDELYLDPRNPRLGRSQIKNKLSQDQIIKLMSDWTLDELAMSFVINGFWPQEALIAVREEVNGSVELVVVEGNRRLAALKMLQKAKSSRVDKRWREIAEPLKKNSKLFSSIPVIVVENREAVQSFLGFRHVTGIKEWHPAEKAQFIAHMIESSGMTYDEVRKRIGSKTPTVRQNYISYRLLLQMEQDEKIDLDEVEEKFSVLYLSLRTKGAQIYLDIDVNAEPADALRPVPDEHLDNLRRFALWLFGDKNRLPVVRDSRQVDDFGKILLSKRAVSYLERSERPTFDAAWQLAGGDEPEVVMLIEEASDNVSLALGKAHRYKTSKKLAKAVERLSTDCAQLLSLFPEIKVEICGGGTK